MKLNNIAILVVAALAPLALATAPSKAQSTGYVTGTPGPDPAGDDEIGWGPAYRPETSFSQPGTPPTPGDFAGAAYRARTGHGPYDTVQGGNRTVGYSPDIGVRPIVRSRIRRHVLTKKHRQYRAIRAQASR